MNFVEFQDGERTFTCRAESSPATPGTLWWWVSITGESQRYAAFRAEPGDAAGKLRPRVLAYYEKLMADRLRPVEPRARWGGRPRPAATTETPAAAPAEQETEKA
jgi:hypothetical protein